MDTGNASEKGSNNGLSQKEEDLEQLQSIVTQIVEEAKRTSLHSIEIPTERKSNSSQELE